MYLLERLRRVIGGTLRSRVAGEDADAKAALIWGAEGERWHGPDDAIWHINGDAAMYAGGIRALLMQALHPAAMAGVAGHSGYRSDPWGRLQRTSEFIATTTYGPIPSAEALIAKIRAVHDRIRGKADDGTPYYASDPHLLAWVHIAETESFLTSFRHFGDRRLTPDEADEYVAQAAPVGEMLGAVDLPRSRAELDAALEAYRPELRASTAALDTVSFLLKNPPVPWPARPGYWMLAAGAIATMPAWARQELSLPAGKWFDRLIGLPLGRFSTNIVRWAMAPESRRDRGIAQPTSGLIRMKLRERVGAADAFPSVVASLMSWEVHRQAGLRVETDGDVEQSRLALLKIGPIKAPVRVTQVVDGGVRAGFTYEALPGHPERGWERFEVIADDGGTWFEIEAWSRPAAWWARLGGPVTRAVQAHVTRRYVDAARAAAA